jgi:hypothetical protein
MRSGEFERPFTAKAVVLQLVDPVGMTSCCPTVRAEPLDVGFYATHPPNQAVHLLADESMRDTTMRSSLALISAQVIG